MFNKNDFIEFIYSIVIYDLKKKRERDEQKMIFTIIWIIIYSI